MKPLKDIVSGFPTEFYSVEHYADQEGGLLHLAHVRLCREEVQLLQTGSYSNLDQLSAACKKGLPVVLLLTGKGVLSKKLVATDPKVEKTTLIHRAFPGIEQEDLVVDVTTIGDGTYVVSALRNTKVLELLKEWEKKFPVVDLHIGIYHLWPMFRQLGPDSLGLGFHQVEVRGGNIIQATKPNEGELEIFGESMPANIAVSFLSAVLKCSTSTFFSELDEIVAKRTDWRYQRYYQKGLLISATSLFFLLMASFLCFSYYSGKVSEMAVLADSFKLKQVEVRTLEESYKQKEQFLLTNGAQNSRMSKMADEIAALVPKEVSLSQMVFHPVEKVLQRENLVRFSRGKLIIAGETQRYTHFQGWLSGLKNLQWTEAIHITGYEEQESGHEANFTIVIKLKE